MTKVSVIIPSRNEQFMPQTVEDILAKATGDIEVIVILDGYWPDPILPDHQNLILVHHGKPKGMRASINAGAAVATGDYLMKCDAHCMFGEGFDEKQTMEALNHANGFLRRELAHRMRLRIVPELRFHYDHSIEKGSQLSALINEAVAQDKDNSEN